MRMLACSRVAALLLVAVGLHVAAQAAAATGSAADNASAEENGLKLAVKDAQEAVHAAEERAKQSTDMLEAVKGAIKDAKEQAKSKSVLLDKFHTLHQKASKDVSMLNLQRDSLKGIIGKLKAEEKHAAQRAEMRRSDWHQLRDRAANEAGIAATLLERDGKSQSSVLQTIKRVSSEEAKTPQEIADVRRIRDQTREKLRSVILALRNVNTLRQQLLNATSPI